MFNSNYEKVGSVSLPNFTGIRIMMMPIIIGDISSIPEFLNKWKDTLSKLFSLTEHTNKIGYLTIDEKMVKKGETHRRAGLHVDGVYNGECGSWGGGGWGSVGNGMLTVSSIAGCEAYKQDFHGWPENDGECEHMRHQLNKGELFDDREVYWVDGLCVHQSIEMPKDSDRQFVRLSLPSNAPWFEGYTENPLGIFPAGKILPKRIYM